MSQYLPASPLMPMQTQNRRVWLLAAGAFATAIAGGYVALYPVLLVVPVAVACIVLVCIRPAWAVLGVVAVATSVEQFTYSIGTRGGPPDESAAALPRSGSRRDHHSDRGVHPRLLARVDLAQRCAAQLRDQPFAGRNLHVCVLGVVGDRDGRRAHQPCPNPRHAVGDCGRGSCSLRPTCTAWAKLKTRRSLDALLWALVIGSGFKALQGVYIFFTYARNLRPRPEAILGHEEAFFFCLFITITAALWLYNVRGRLRTTATALLPIVP